jgi:hypothetical protein
VSDILPLPSKYHCPACGREIYLRRRATCEFCGKALPESMRLSPDELEAVDQEMKEMHERRERDKEREEAAKRETRRRQDGDAGAYIGGF